MSTTPYTPINARDGAALLLDPIARRLGATIPAGARAGLVALLEEALCASRDGDIEDARALMSALITTITRRWTHADVRDAA